MRLYDRLIFKRIIKVCYLYKKPTSIDFHHCLILQPKKKEWKKSSGLRMAQKRKNKVNLCQVRLYISSQSFVARYLPRQPKLISHRRICMCIYPDRAIQEYRPATRFITRHARNSYITCYWLYYLGICIYTYANRVARMSPIDQSCISRRCAYSRFAANGKYAFINIVNWRKHAPVPLRDSILRQLDVTPF